jgi:hypothetical protein
MSLGRVIVAGSRGTACPPEWLDDVLNGVIADGFGDHVEEWEVVHGNCPRSPDISGKEWGELRGYTVTPFPANWDKHGKAAGMLRNRDMAEYAAEADFGLLIALWDGKSPGTANMIANAAADGLHVVVHRD